MEIERILDFNQGHTGKEVLEMIISNRINYYLGDEIGAAITVKNFSLLAEDLLKWRESTRPPVAKDRIND